MYERYGKQCGTGEGGEEIRFGEGLDVSLFV